MTIDLEKFKLTPEQQSQKKKEIDLQRFKLKSSEAPKSGSRLGGFAKAVGNALISSERKFGQSIGDAIYAPFAQKQIEKEGQNKVSQLQDLTEKRKEMKAGGRDTTRIDNLIQIMLGEQGTQLADITPSVNKSAKQIFGEGLGVAADIASFGSYGKAATMGLKSGVLGKAIPNVVGGAQKATTFISGAVKGAKTAAKTGAVLGGVQGVAHGMQDDRSVGDIAALGVGGAVAGGAIAGTIGGITGGVGGMLRGRAIRKEELNRLLSDKTSSVTQKLQQRNPDVSIKDLAKTDPTVKNAVSKGIDNTEALVARLSSDADKAKMSKMLNIARLAQNNPTSSSRPTDIVGETFMSRVKGAKGLLEKAGTQLDETATVLRGKASNLAPIRQSFDDELLNAGISSGKEGLNFRGSDFDDLPGVQKAFNNVYRRLQDVGDDAFKAHQLKKYIYNIVDYSKTGEGLTGSAERVLKGVARELDGVLDDAFPDYNAANTLYHSSKNVLDDVSRLVGKNLTKMGDFGNVKAGSVMRRLLSNTGNRADLLQMLDNMENLLTNNNYKTNESIINQVVFADMLEDVFGTQAKTSLQGQVGRGVESAINRTGGGGTTLIDLGKKAVTGAYKFAKQVTPEERLDAINQLLKPTSKPITPFVMSGPRVAGSSEEIIEKAGGWATGLREKFDRALTRGDISTIKDLLPKVPTEYKAKFANKIAKVLNKTVLK